MEIVRKLSKKEKEALEQQEAMVNQERINKAQQEFDTFNSVLTDKVYPVKLDSQLTDYLMYYFLENVKFKGYEAYAIKEIFESLEAIKIETEDKKYLIEGSLKAEIIEALFYFIKSYEGKGYGEAKNFKNVADTFAVPMQQINEDRQTLRDLSLELVAAEQGVEVEKIKEQYSQQNQ